MSGERQHFLPPGIPDAALQVDEDDRFPTQPAWENTLWEHSFQALVLPSQIKTKKYQTKEGIMSARLPGLLEKDFL